jgi:hypothetical protein
MRVYDFFSQKNQRVSSFFLMEKVDFFAQKSKKYYSRE